MSDTLDLPPDEVEDLREALSGPLPSIPSRYLYDDHGSELFEAITRTPEYYQTRTELAILEANADALVARADCRRLAEIGSGSGRKIGLLIDAARTRGTVEQVTLFDINQAFLDESVERLAARFPGLPVDGVQGRFTKDLHRLGPGGHRMILFFGSTIGNFPPEEVVPFLRQLAAVTGPDDTLLIGFDQVKDPAILEAAYNDTQGLNAAFNLNILRGFNRATGADFDPELFEHVAFYDADQAWIEMRLRARSPCSVHVPAVGMRLDLDTGDEIRTEVSCKYTRAAVSAYAARAGLVVDAWVTDPDDLFALGLLRRSPETP